MSPFLSPFVPSRATTLTRMPYLFEYRYPSCPNYFIESDIIACCHSDPATYFFVDVLQCWRNALSGYAAQRMALCRDDTGDYSYFHSVDDNLGY